MSKFFHSAPQTIYYASFFSLSFHASCSELTFILFFYLPNNLRYQFSHIKYSVFQIDRNNHRPLCMQWPLTKKSELQIHHLYRHRWTLSILIYTRSQVKKVISRSCGIFFDFQKGTLRDIGQNEMSSKTVILPSFPIAKYKVWNWWSQFFLGTWDVDKDGWNVMMTFDLHPR